MKETLSKKERAILARALATPYHRAYGAWGLLWGLATKKLLVPPTGCGLVWTLTDAGVERAQALKTPETTDTAQTQSNSESDTFK